MTAFLVYEREGMERNRDYIKLHEQYGRELGIDFRLVICDEEPLPDEKCDFAIIRAMRPDITEALEARGIPYAIHDVAGNIEPGLGVSGAIRDVFKYDTLAVGSPTYNNSIFPPVETFMRAVSARLVKGRKFYAFGSYTWAGSSVNKLNELAKELDFEIIAEGGSFAQAFTPDKCDMAAIAELMK